MKSIETRLTDFGIAGKIVRLQNFADPGQIVDDEVRKGATSIIIVGNDETFGRVLSKAADKNIVFGFIPIGPQNNTIAKVLGIPLGVEAATVLSKRRKVDLDIGWFNNRFFVSQLRIPPSPITVTYDKKFSVGSQKARVELVVCNLMPYQWRDKKKHVLDVHPQDGKLEAFLRPVQRRRMFRDEYEDPSIFPFQEMIVEAKKAFPVYADGKLSKETRIHITLAKHTVQMIVGKERKF